MYRKVSLFIILLILINMITLSTMHIPKRGDKKEAGVEYNINDGKYGYFVCGIWFPLFESGAARPRTFNHEVHSEFQAFPETICRIKDRWSELLFA